MPKARRERVLLLETQLDHELSSERSQVPYMRELFRNFAGVELVAREAHSRADLRKFLEVARRDRQIRAVHLVAHGLKKRKKTSIVLTRNESVDLSQPAGRKLFEDLGVESLFFSCCQLGQDAKLMGKILDTSRAHAVFSYTRDVNDYQAFLIESLFYHLAYGYVRGRLSRVPLREVHEKLKFALDYLGIDSGKEPLTEPLLAAEFR